MHVNIAMSQVAKVASCDLLHLYTSQSGVAEFVHGQFELGLAMSDVAKKVELGLQHGIAADGFILPTSKTAL